MGLVEQESSDIFAKMCGYVRIRNGKKRLEEPSFSEAHTDLTCMAIHRAAGCDEPDYDELLQLLNADEPRFFRVYANATEVVARHDRVEEAA